MTHKTAFTVATWVILSALLALPAAAGEMGETMAANMADVEKKIVDLANAIPEDKYGWSPSEGVRSVKDAMTHVAGANFFFAGRMGADVPADGREKVKTAKSKADVVAVLTASFASLKEGLKMANMGEKTKLFGGKEGTIGDLALIAVGHGHEHLGQLIAYARSNNVKPPWSN